MGKNAPGTLKKGYEVALVIVVILALIDSFSAFVGYSAESAVTYLSHGITSLVVAILTLGHLQLSTRRTRFHCAMPVVAFLTMLPVILFYPLLLSGLIKGFPPVSSFEREVSYVGSFFLLLFLAGVPASGLALLYRFTR